MPINSIYQTHGSGEKWKAEAGYIFADDGTPILAFRNLDDTKPQCDADCHGVTFAEGKFWIDNNQVSRIIRHDGYVEVDAGSAKIGDKVVYADGVDKINNNFLLNTDHSTTIFSIDEETGEITVIGKGGVEPNLKNEPLKKAWNGPDTETRIYRKKETDKKVSDEEIKKLTDIQIIFIALVQILNEEIEMIKSK